MSGSPAKHTAQCRIKREPDPDENGSGTTSVPASLVANSKPISAHSNHLEKLASSSSVSELESAVQVGIRLLEDLRAPLNATRGDGDPQVAHWLQCIQQVELKAKPPRTVVGVVGVTGAGKSSVINALLDEERLVPTSGLRACTASATEISFNHSDDPSELYRAEVEFISADDWSQELKTLLNDLIEIVDGTPRISPDCYNPDTDAGLAYSKIRAVYPKKKRDDIVRQASNPDDIAREPEVHGVLGSTKLLCATSSSGLFESLKQYIDSKDHEGNPNQDKENSNKRQKKSKKDNEKDKDKPKKPEKKMEYWPLIKVVRIYSKAAALSTGVVLVDLPGVQDSNAARAAVAKNYMKACNGIWITADIQRAVNAKIAKKLLGDSFRRQLKYDGALSTVIFVCTKTDDILPTEVGASLGIEDELGDYWQKANDLDSERNELTSQIESLKEQKREFDELLEKLDLDNEQWEELQEELGGDKPLYAPSDITKKRKREITPSSDVDAAQDDTDNGETGQTSEAPDTPLTEGDIERELATIKIHKKEARKKKKSLEKEISRARHALDEVTKEGAETKSDMLRLCIQRRNEYVKVAIQQDFALGIKELDQEVSIEEDEADFDPEEEKRDYDELARSLPVFCVSSRSYQNMAGRLEKDMVQTDGFAFLEDTEIPQLQEHAKRVTERGRVSTSQLFLNELNRLLHSMMFWASGITCPTMIQEEVEVDERLLDNLFTKLDNSLRETIEDCHSSMKHDLEKNLLKTFDTLIPAASDSALETATGWGKPREENGLQWSSYKATCRRDGCWKGTFGKRDFNEELFEPINRQLAGNWERVFQRRIPRTLRTFAQECKEHLESFHGDVAANMLDASASWTSVSGLDQQKRAYQKMLDTTPNFFGAKITEIQREVNRGFTPVIQAAMKPAYEACTNERGEGTFVRMKAIMESHVATARNTMFRQACDSVQRQLDSMCVAIEKSLTVFVQDLLAKIRRDYRAILAGRCDEASAEVPLGERVLRDQMRLILDDADYRFAEFRFAASEDSRSEESLIAQQLQDGMVQNQEDVPNSGMEKHVKSESA
ncbi:hypothetical protein KVR01_005775 [Diaporthe batatas]|uniref:uncharacterized protein n=1 Tax=Diaporthe batatas TaxID=748121 RepID=UPI001D04CCEA|nr:uncharacterized protein KVR01_005775 [Diaporthe batatas]KAG8163857.1 hypothetical protein KVR01_005775 [Diaporthe batatas]